MKILEESYYDDLLKDLEEIFREQQKDVIAIICARLRAVGKLNPTSAKQLARMAKYQSADLKEIEKVIKKASRMAEKEIDAIFEQAAETSREYAEVLAYTAGGGTYEANFQTLMSAAAREYKDMVLNLSETYAFKTDGKVLSIRQQYIKAVNRAVSAVSTGTLDYNTAIRQTVKQMVDSGLRTRQRTGEKVLEWPESGYTRRVDSSVRMNVLEGVRRMNQAVLDDAAEKYATGYEISAHDRPAPDHADIQGRQYTRADFENLNASLARPIGTLNCMHIAFPIIYGVSKPAYTEEQLAAMKSNAVKEYTWKGKKLTGYECTQMQRKYETAIRRAKEQEVAFKAAGNDLDAKRARRNARHLTEEYREFSDHVGLSVKGNRLQTISPRQLFAQHFGSVEIPPQYDGVFDDINDYGGLELTDEETTALRGLNQLSKKQQFEYACTVVNGKATPAFTSEIRDKVAIDHSLLSNTGVKIFHSHTNVTPFSETDFRLLLNKNVDEIGVIAYNGDVFTAKVGYGYRPTLEEYNSEIRAIIEDVNMAMLDHPDNNGWSAEQLNYMAIREQAYRIARAFGWELKGGRIDV